MFFKTIAPIVVKFQMKHNQTPGFQNYKIGSGQESKMVAITKKNSKNNKINFNCRTIRNFGRHIEIAPPSARPSVHLSVRQSVRYKLYLSKSSLTTKANLMKLQRKIKDNDKVCHAHDYGSYAQGQGHNQVRGQNCVSAITQKKNN